MPEGNWCTLFPDEVFPDGNGNGIDLSYACYRHDMAYLKRIWSVKFRADYELFLDVWYLADQVDDFRKYYVKALSPIMGLAVFVFGTPLFAWGCIKDKLGISEGFI